MIGTRKLGHRSVNPVGLGCMSLSWAYGVPPGEADAVARLAKDLSELLAVPEVR